MESDYILQEVKGIKKSFDNGSKLSLEQFIATPYLSVKNDSEYTDIFTSTEGLGQTKELAEMETPPVLRLQDGRSITLVSKRFGNSINVTEADQVKFGDSTIKVREFLMRQRDRSLRSIHEHMNYSIHRMLNEAFTSTSEFLAPDGVELCGAHSWANGDAWTNKATAALSSAAIDAAFEYAGAFVDSAGQPMFQDWDTIVVKKGSAAHNEAVRLFAKDIVPTAVNDINIYEGGMLRVIATPYITTTNKNFWFLFASKLEESPLYMGITKTATLSDPILEKNNSVTTNATAFWKQGINNMPFNVYGSNGTTA